MMESAFISMTPLVFASLGGLLSEKAGILNISLEGCIGAGAFVTAVMLHANLSLGTALAGAILVGILSGALMGALHLGFGANLFIVGLGINLLLPSTASLISQILFDQQGIIRFAPQNLTAFPWLSILAVFTIGAVLKYSSYGRNIRAADCGREFLLERGVSLKLVQMSVLLMSSGLAALSGAILSLRIGAYVPNMSAGKGWIALVMIWMGFRYPPGVLVSCYVFALFEIASGRIQGVATGMATVMPSLPYLGALLALAVISPRRMKRDT